MQQPKSLIVMALPQESRGLLEKAGASVLYTGVGKVNAASALARRLAEIRCTGEPLPLVVNLGTAGSRSIPAHSLVACDRFVQRDMDVSGLGFPRGVTPFDETPPTIAFPRVLSELPHATCSTADSFATHEHEIDGDVVDMEVQRGRDRGALDEQQRQVAAAQGRPAGRSRPPGVAEQRVEPAGRVDVVDVQHRHLSLHPTAHRATLPIDAPRITCCRSGFRPGD